MKTVSTVGCLLVLTVFVTQSVPVQAITILFREDFNDLDNWRPLTFPKIKKHSTYTIETDKGMESRRVLAIGMSVAAACNLVLGWLVDSGAASVFLWMCVTMGIFGFAQATGWPHNIALFANWTRRSERGTLFGIWGTCYQFGAIFGKGLAGFLLGWLGLAWSFFGSSLLLLAFTVYFVLRARERPQSVGLSLEDEAEPDIAAPGPRKAGDAREAALPVGFVASIVAMGLDLLRLQVPAVRARQLVGADPRRAFLDDDLDRRLLVHRLRLDRFPRRAGRRLLVGSNGGLAAYTGDLLPLAGSRTARGSPQSRRRPLPNALSGYQHS